MGDPGYNEWIKVNPINPIKAIGDVLSKNARDLHTIESMIDDAYARLFPRDDGLHTAEKMRAIHSIISSICDQEKAKADEAINWLAAQDNRSDVTKQ